MHQRTLRSLRYMGYAFVWLGLAMAVLYLGERLPDISSFTGLLVSIAGTIELMTRTVGLGALLILLAEIIDILSKGR